MGVLGILLSELSIPSRIIIDELMELGLAYDKTFNSIKDYLSHGSDKNTKERKSFQFHQGLSEYFYTLTTLLFLPPLI